MSEDATETDVTIDPMAKLQERCEQLERELVQVKQKANTTFVKAHLRAEAARAGMIDLDGLKMLDTSEVTINDEGEVQGANLLMERARKEKPWLFHRMSTSNAAGVPPSQSLRQKLATEMTDTEYKAAREAIIRYRP